MKNWIKKNNRYVEFWVWMVAMTVLLLLMSSCSSIKVLPLNTPQETPIDQDMEMFQPHYDYCEQFEYDAETWMECMMNEQIRQNTIRRLA